ncbi:MAG: hypothetical protein Q9160_007906 [Pyrenula sp. 1 TL-2023]
MASRARGRQGTERNTKRKRANSTFSAQDSPKEPTSQERNTKYPREYQNGWWPIKRIYKESRTRYLIKWKKDPITFKEYPKVWVNKAKLTEAAVDEWEARQRNLRSSSVLGNSDWNEGSRPDRSLESSPEAPAKRRKLSHRRVVHSSPISSSPNQRPEKDRQSNQNIEIQETQERSADKPDVGIQISPRPSLNRDDYGSIPPSTFSSQNVHSETPNISSSKETDHDSAVGLASPSSEESQDPALALTSIETSSRHTIQAAYSNTFRDTIDQIEATGSGSLPGEYIARAGSEDSVLYPEFRFEQRNPDLSPDRTSFLRQLSPLSHSSLSRESHTGVDTQLDRACRKTTPFDSLSSNQSTSRLHQGPLINDLQTFSKDSSVEWRNRLRSGSLVIGAGRRSFEHFLESVPRIIRNMADMPTASNSSPLQPADMVKSSSQISLQEKTALDITGNRAALQTSSSSNLPYSSMPASTSPKAMVMRPDPALAAQSLTADSAETAKLNFEVEDVLPTTELPATMQIDSILSPTSEPDQAIPLVPSLDLPRYQQSQPRFQRPLLTPPDYAVTLPAAGHMRHRYREWFQEKDLRLLGRFLQKPSSAFAKSQGSSTLLERINGFVNQLKLATIHPDFNADSRVYESMTQTDPEPSQETTWADMASTKFAFLGNLIEDVRTANRPVAIIASTEQSAATLETYFRGRRVPYRHLKGNNYVKSDEEQNSSFTLINSSDEGAQQSLLASRFSPEVIIDLDGSLASTDPLIRIMQQSAGVRPAIPIIHLIVINSPQHIENCLANTLTPLEWLQHLVIAATHLRREIGKLPGGFEGMSFNPTQIDYEAIEDVPQLAEFESQTRTLAARVAQFIRSHDSGESWSLPPLPALDLVGIEATMAMLDGDGDSRLASKSRTGTPAGVKRTRDQPLAPGSSKRLRMTPLQDVTHISDSLQESQSELEDLRSALRTRESTLASTLRNKERLQNSLLERDAQLEDMTLSLSALQHRYETQKKDFHRLRKENRLLESKKAASDSMRERLSSENVSLREQRAQLQNDLHAAQLALKEGGGTTADLESLREANEKLQKERDSCQKSIEHTKRDFEFTRQQYQHASSTASDLASQSAENEAEIAKLKIQASDEKRRLREMNVNEHEKQHRVAVIRLEDQVATMEKLLMKKEEELERARRGRGVQTRAGSAQPQPGSPRLVGRGGGESRGASPIPGMLGDSRLGYAHGSGGIGVSGGRTSALRREA